MVRAMMDDLKDAFERRNYEDILERLRYDPQSFFKAFEGEDLQYFTGEEIEWLIKKAENTREYNMGPSGIYSELILRALEISYGALVMVIQDDNVFKFEDLALLDNRSIQVLIREISRNVLLYALKDSPENIYNLFIRNLSTRAANNFKEDMKGLENAQQWEIEEARQKVINCVKRLEEDYSIIINRS